MTNNVLCFFLVSLSEPILPMFKLISKYFAQGLEVDKTYSSRCVLLKSALSLNLFG